MRSRVGSAGRARRARCSVRRADDGSADRSTGRPIGALVVAGWYPAFDGPGRGAFVAEQVDALRRTGRVDVAVLSFEDVRLVGTAAEQQAAAGAVDAIDRLAAAAHGAADWPARAVHGPVSVPVHRARVAHLSEGVRTAHADSELHAAAARRAPLPRQAIDLVHAHAVVPDGVAGAAIAADYGWPLIITEHASYAEAQLADPVTRAVYLAAAAQANRLVTVSETLAQRLRRAAPELGPKIVVIPNAVGLPVADASIVRRTDELLYVGVRRRTKGTGVLLQAMARIAPRGRHRGCG